MLKNVYFLAEIGADTADKERNFAKKLATTKYPWASSAAPVAPAGPAPPAARPPWLSDSITKRLPKFCGIILDFYKLGISNTIFTNKY